MSLESDKDDGGEKKADAPLSLSLSKKKEPTVPEVEGNADAVAILKLLKNSPTLLSDSADRAKLDISMVNRLIKKAGNDSEAALSLLEAMVEEDTGVTSLEELGQYFEALSDELQAEGAAE